MSRVADGEAELTEARDRAWARRWAQNGRRPSVSGGGATWSRAQSERGGERVWLRAQVSVGNGRADRGAQKGRGRAEVAGERMVVGVSMAREHGREVRDTEGADGWGPRDRERERERV
jgi:hypothetical protein